MGAGLPCPVENLRLRSEWDWDGTREWTLPMIVGLSGRDLQLAGRPQSDERIMGEKDGDDVPRRRWPG